MTKVSQDSAERILDVEQARTAALAEHEQREAVDWSQYDNCHVSTCYAAPGNPCRKLSGAERDIPHTDRLTLAESTDDGPGHDQHGSHERDGMVGPAYRVEHAPPATDPELETRVRNTIYLVEQSTIGRRFAARQIIATVREHDAAATRYTDRLPLPAGLLDVPPTGPRWQVLDGKDERTWHDLTATTNCEDPNCVSIAGNGDPDASCTVLVAEAWSAGFAHFDAADLVDVRIPASRGAQA
jgi:hypothetical protein